MRNEGVLALYKGATPPLIGWMFMDSLMLGSLTVYRRLLAEHVFNPSSSLSHAAAAAAVGVVSEAVDAEAVTGELPPPTRKQPVNSSSASPHLPLHGHAAAGLLSGWTVSLLAAPVEHVKARLQVQYSASRKERFYSGPVDCARRIVRHHGIRRGLYRGLGATLVFRSGFGPFWVAYDIFSRWLRGLDVSSVSALVASSMGRQTGLGGEDERSKGKKTLSTAAVNFWAGGLSAQVFWIVSYPADVVKQRIMTEPLGGGLGDGTPKYDKGRWRWGQAARAVYVEAGGWRGFWRGFLPCFLRSFPANGKRVHSSRRHFL